MNERELLQEELKKVEGRIEILNRQIENNNGNITGLVAQGTRYMDRRDMLETRKAELEAELAGLEPEQPLE